MLRLQTPVFSQEAFVVWLPPHSWLTTAAMLTRVCENRMAVTVQNALGWPSTTKNEVIAFSSFMFIEQMVTYQTKNNYVSAAHSPPLACSLLPGYGSLRLTWC